jgi:hypothetical protein
MTGPLVRNRRWNTRPPRADERPQLAGYRLCPIGGTRPERHTDEDRERPRPLPVNRISAGRHPVVALKRLESEPSR